MLPDPYEVPAVALWPDAGQLLGLGRSATYEAARRGEIPTLRFGRAVRVPTAALHQLLGLPLPARGEAPVCTGAPLTTPDSHDEKGPRHDDT